MGKGLFGFLGRDRTVALTIEEFRARVVEEVSRRDPDIKAETTGEAELIRQNGDRISIAQPYLLYRQHPRALESLVSQAANFFFDQPAPATLEGLIVDCPTRRRFG